MHILNSNWFYNMIFLFNAILDAKNALVIALNQTKRIHILIYDIRTRNIRSYKNILIISHFNLTTIKYHVIEIINNNLSLHSLFFVWGMVIFHLMNVNDDDDGGGGGGAGGSSNNGDDEE